jgi:hypothetical protein
VAKVAPPANYKKEDTIAQWWATEGEAKKQEAIAATALDGTWGEVFCIGVAVNDGPVEILTALTEYELFENFGEHLNSECQDSIHSGDMWPIIATWVGHNIIDFDLRFLWQRQKLLGITLPFQLPIKRDSGRVFDTMKEWCGYKDRVSQKDLELAFGLKRDDPLPNGGSDVYASYKAGKLDEIKSHCTQDITLLRDLYRRMTA